MLVTRSRITTRLAGGCLLTLVLGGMALGAVELSDAARERTATAVAMPARTDISCCDGDGLGDGYLDDGYLDDDYMDGSFLDDDPFAPEPEPERDDDTFTSGVKAFGAVAGLVGSLVAAAAARRRQEPYKRFAARNRFRYAAADPSLARAWEGAPFVHSRTAQAQCVMSGALGQTPFVTFEYRYVVQLNNTPVAQYVWVGVLKLPAALPDLHVGPEWTFATMFPGLVPMDVDIESEAFNRMYRVHIDQHPAARKYAVDILNPRTAEALVAAPPFHWRISGNELIGWWPPGTPEDTMAHLATMRRVADGVPSFVWRDYGRPHHLALAA